MGLFPVILLMGLSAHPQQPGLTSGLTGEVIYISDTPDVPNHPYLEGRILAIDEDSRAALGFAPGQDHGHYNFALSPAQFQRYVVTHAEIVKGQYVLPLEAGDYLVCLADAGQRPTTQVYGCVGPQRVENSVTKRDLSFGEAGLTPGLEQ